MAGQGGVGASASVVPAGERLSRLPELVARILRIARQKELEQQREETAGSSHAGYWSRHAVLREAMRVDRTWAACGIELLYEHLVINSPKSLEQLIKCLGIRRRRIAGRGVRDRLMAWSAGPLVVRVLDFSHWRFQIVNWHAIESTVMTLPSLWHRMQWTGTALETELRCLAVELSCGPVLQGCVSRILFPELKFIGSRFDALLLPVIPPLEDQRNLVERFDYELSRIFFLGPGTLVALLESSPEASLVQEFRGGHDLGIVELFRAAETGLLSNLATLGIHNNLARFLGPSLFNPDPMDILKMNSGSESVPYFYRENTEMPFRLIDTPVESLVQVWSSLTNLTTLDFGHHGAPLALILAVKHCKSLRVLRCGASQAEAPDLGRLFDPRRPHNNEQMVEKIIEYGSLLEELDMEIGLGNASIPNWAEELLSPSTDSFAPAPSRLRKLKLVYNACWSFKFWDQGEDTADLYDADETPAFLSRLASRTARTLSHLELELMDTQVPLEHAEFQVCTALEEVSIRQSLWSWTTRQESARFPGLGGLVRFDPGKQLLGSRETLRKLSLTHVALRQMHLLRDIAFGKDNGTLSAADLWRFVDAAAFPEFSRLETLHLQFTDMYFDPVLFWLGRCPALRHLIVFRPFRLPYGPRCSFLGQERTGLFFPEGRDGPGCAVDDFESPYLQLAFPATVEILEIRDSVIDVLEPSLSNVASLQLGYDSMRRRSVSNPTLRRVLSQATRLEELKIEYPRIDVGTLKAISDLRPPNLRKVSFSTPYTITPKKLRLNALEGFVRKMAAPGESGERTRIKFNGIYSLVDRPDRLRLERYTRAGQRGDRAVSKARHIEEFRRQRQSLVRTVQELGIGWITSMKTPDLESDDETWLWRVAVADEDQE